MVMVTGSRTGDSPNVGKMGTAVRRANDDDPKVAPTAFGSWIVEGPGLRCNYTRNGVHTWKLDNMCLSDDKYLMRIDPEPDPLEVTKEQPIEVI